MKTFNPLFSVLFILVLAFPVLAQDEWNIMTEELPPFNFTDDGLVYGISTDTLLTLMERIGAPVERKAIKMMPWPRAYRTVLNTPGSLLYSTARTKQREKLFKWVGPITDLTVGLIARKDRNIQIYSIEDVQQYKIGSILDGAPEQLVLQAGIKESNLDRLADPELNIKKLQAGRIDLFAFNAPTTRYLMIKLGINPDEFEVVYSLKTADLYFAFHRETDDRFIAAMNRELLEMKKVDSKGVSSFQTIVDNYLNP